MPKRFRANYQAASILIAWIVFAAPPAFPAAAPSPDSEIGHSRPEIFHLDGDFFTPTAESRVKTWTFPVENNTIYKKIVVQLDVTPRGWWANNPDGVHNIFWLTRAATWRSSTVGYVNFFGPERNLLKQMTNLTLAAGVTKASTTNFAPQEEHTYHVTYTYDCEAGLVTTTIAEKGAEKARVQMPATASKILTKGGFYRLWIGLDEKYNECPTLGWTYSNLTLRLEPGMAEKQESARGPLTVHAANPRYFDDGTSRTVLLAGVNHGWELLDDAWTTQYKLDWPTFLDYLRESKLNYIRMWRVESTTATGDPKFLATPATYKRTGPGNAIDGGLKYDLGQFNPDYFDRLRKRCLEAGERGIYVSVMLFEKHSTYNQRESGGAEYPWKAHPFHPANNINGLSPDLDGDGCPREIHHLPRASDAPAKRQMASRLLEIQKAYVVKVIDTLNDLDNIIYEVCNEALPDSNTDSWQRHMVDFVKEYEAGKPKQHLVGFTGPGLENKGDPWPDLAEQIDSNADFVSPRNNDEYRKAPPVADGAKVIFADSDHIDPYGRDDVWVWKSFMRGLHPQALESYGVKAENMPNVNLARDKLVRKSMGQCLDYTRRMDLASMTPRPDLASTNYCLANPGFEYLAFAPGGGSARQFTVDLSEASGPMAVEWLHSRTGKRNDGGIIKGGAAHEFTPPFAGPAVVYIKQAFSQEQ